MHIHRVAWPFFLVYFLFFFRKTSDFEWKHVINNDDWQYKEYCTFRQIREWLNYYWILVERIHGGETTRICGCLPPSRQTHVTPCYITLAICVWHAWIQWTEQQTSDAYCLQYVTQCTQEFIYWLYVKERKKFSIMMTMIMRLLHFFYW